ncbi:ROK family protein [Paratractidigestivibacter sp.]|uniref:ROK family protein n=1 Tax=Paratractidigestivibacter sp. TaxID=2847316 RepID=UPI002ABE007B|nr:ROK family protein [Paratractidigestivibacter sp.]
MAAADIRLGALEAGGTKMVCAVGTADGTVLERESFPTLTPGETLPGLVEWFESRGVAALGIGAFGPTRVDPKAADFGAILETPKVAWRGCQLRDAFAEKLGVPVGYDTDVNVACLGEATFGSCKGLDDCVYVTIGTGIGAGVMCGGNLLHGMLHPEAGHMLVTRVAGDEGPCKCPSHASCLEGMAAGPSIELRWGKPAAELVERNEVWELEGDYLAQMCMNLILCYSPKRIVLGGGVMHQEQLFPIVRKKTLEYLGGYISAPELEDIDSYIVPAGCGGDQGILGCLELARRAL